MSIKKQFIKTPVTKCMFTIIAEQKAAVITDILDINY